MPSPPDATRASVLSSTLCYRGAKTIHLCGFDLNTPGHYYAEGGPSVTTINNFLMHFRTGLRILLDHGIEIISHSPVSRLNDMIPYEAL